eukprot:gnl/TRDRNA2_/TRDRNA2_85164_c0_seq1.p1 gnl/TRDRNA2_/TRDRNA2_85164_c0~~gnl/TRDRNA2_/TRDRNA2_85164_c0_seq1.p1  ORF type:complete len:574 (-),score=105.83 gnl/TRDRNA2_/TRDRNA2_85164_c0_seq1:124-1845(-)
MLPSVRGPAGTGHGMDAHALLNEVTHLEKALREATARKQAAAAALQQPRGPSSGAPPTGAHMVEHDAHAVASYGLQLKAWVDCQVDQRLEQLLGTLIPDLSELAAARRDGAQALAMIDHLRSDLHGMTEAHSKLLGVADTLSQEVTYLKMAATKHSKLLGVVEGLSEEVTYLKASTANRSEAIATVEKVVGTIDELKHSVARNQDAQVTVLQLERHEAALAELSRRQDRHDKGLSDLESATSALMGTRNEVASMVRAVRQLEDKVDQHKEELTTGAKQLELHRDLVAGTQTAREELESLRAALVGTATREEVTAAMRSALEVSSEATREEVDARLRESQVSLARKLDVWQVRLERDLSTESKRLVQELRLETQAALKDEHAAVKALDQQLWLTDQRLGQRVDAVSTHLSSRPGTRPTSADYGRGRRGEAGNDTWASGGSSVTGALATSEVGRSIPLASEALSEASERLQKVTDSINYGANARGHRGFDSPRSGGRSLDSPRNQPRGPFAARNGAAAPLRQQGSERHGGSSGSRTDSPRGGDGFGNLAGFPRDGAMRMLAEAGEAFAERAGLAP